MTTNPMPPDNPTIPAKASNAVPSDMPAPESTAVSMSTASPAITTTPAKAAAVPDEEPAFPFFDLQCEMRDMVYDFARADVKAIQLPETRDDPDGEYLRVHTRDGPLPHLPLVSKQFLEKYCDYVKKEDATLILEDWHAVLEYEDENGRPMDDWYSIEPFPPSFPAFLQSLAKVELLFHIRFYNTMDDWLYARRLLAYISSQMKGKRLTVKSFIEDHVDFDGYYYWPETEHYSPKGHLEDMAEVEGVERVEFLWDCIDQEDGGLASHGVLNQEAKWLKIWTENGGWSVVNPDADKLDADQAQAVVWRREALATMNLSTPPES